MLDQASVHHSAAAQEKQVRCADDPGTAALAETFDPNPFERLLARTGEPAPSVDALGAQEPQADACCAVGLAHSEGRPTLGEAMSSVPAQGGELVGVKSTSARSAC